MSLAFLVAVGALAFALFLPEFGCRAGWRLSRDAPPPAGSPNGWVCSSEDVRYVPDSRMPLKVGIALGGVGAAGLLGLVGSRTDGAKRKELEAAPPS
jgi:hypothetical protein